MDRVVHDFGWLVLALCFATIAYCDLAARWIRAYLGGDGLGE